MSQINPGPSVQQSANTTAQMAVPAGAGSPTSAAVYATDTSGNPTALVGQNGASVNIQVLGNPSLSNAQATVIYPAFQQSGLRNTNAIPWQYDPSDPQCILARTFLTAPTQNPVGNEVGVLNGAPSNTNAQFDGTYGLNFSSAGAAVQNAVLTLDVSNFTQLQNGTPYMIYFEIEKSYLAPLPATSGLSSASTDYGGGIAWSQATSDVFCLWPSTEGGVNGQLLTMFNTYTSGSGAKGWNIYSSGSNTAIGFNPTDVHKLDGEQYIPLVFAFDSGTVCGYTDGACGNASGPFALPVAVQNMVLKTITFGRRNSGTTDYSIFDGHIRNLMIIAGRTPYSTKTYGLQVLTPANVFTNTLNFGDSYAQINTNAYIPTGLDAVVKSYLGKFGLCLPNNNETVTTFGTTTNTSFPGRRFVGWSSATDGSGQTGTAPVNAALPDQNTFPVASGQSYLWNNIGTFLANNPTCVVFQMPVNDRGASFNEAAYARWLKYYLERFFGLNGNLATTVQAVVLVSSGYPPFLSDGSSKWRKMSARMEYNAIVSTIAWFQRTYPALASKIAFGDWYNAIGGDTPFQQCWLPLMRGDIHPSTFGKYTQGLVWAQSLMNLSHQLNGNGVVLDAVGPVKQLLRTYQAPPLNANRLIGQLRGANFNVTTDQAIYLDAPGSSPASTRFVIDQIIVTNPNTNPTAASGGQTPISLTTAQGGFYTGAGKTGTTLVASTQAYTTLTGAGIPLSVTLAAGGTGTVLDSKQTSVTVPLNQPIYFSLTTGQGATAYADIYVFGRDLT